MGPRSTALIVVLAAAAVALLAVMIWQWPALARRGLAPVFARIALLVGLQVSVLGLIFVYVNRTYEFYASWSDLLGTTYIPGKIVAVQQRPGGTGGQPGAGRPSMGRPGQAPLLAGGSGAGGSGAARPGPAPLGGGRTVPGTLPAAMVRLTSTPVLVPGARRGAGGSLEKVRVTGPVSGSTAKGCLDVPAGPQAATFFSQDLPAALTHGYRVDAAPSGWAVLGGVGGGYCALQLATLPSGPFAVAAVRPGIYAAPPGRLAAGTGPWLRSQDNLLWRLRNWPPPPVRVLFAGPGHARRFQSLVRPPMSAVTGSLGAGSAPLAPVLDWIGHALAG